MSITLIERRRYHTAIHVYRDFTIISTQYFYYTVDTTSCVAHNAHCLFVLRVRTTLAKKSLYFRGMQIWNSLNPTHYEARKLVD